MSNRWRRGRRRRGFTLVELLVVTAGVAVLAQGFYVWNRAAVADSMVDRAIEAFVAIDEAAYGFRIANAGTWPGSIDPALAPYLGAAAVDDLDDRGFSVAAVGNTFTIGGDMPSEAEAEAVARAFPGTGAAGGAVNARGLWPVTLTVTVPGQESAREALLPRDGSRAMFGNIVGNINVGVDMGGGLIDMDGGGLDVDGGDIDLGGGDVLGSDDAEAEALELTTTVTIGDACTVGSMGVDGAGRPASCIGGVWTADAPCTVEGAPASYTNRVTIYHELVLETDCGTLAGIPFEGSNA